VGDHGFLLITLLGGKELDSMKKFACSFVVAAVAMLFVAGAGIGAEKKMNPCAAKKANPCATKAANPCNPCAAKAKKAANPCNPCAAKKAANPCAAKKAANPCKAKK
jgi:hypothetical protein